MSRHVFAFAATAAAALLSGCATHQTPIAIAMPAPPPVPVQVAAMPAGAYPGMPVPARLPDGRYATPNRGLDADGTVWHLRAALNVAALACRGAEGDAIVAGYNAMLGRAKAPLANAQARYAASFRVAGPGGDARYDDAMTRLYNFFSQSQARSGFCAAAAQVLTESANVVPDAMPTFAQTALPQLEQPFIDFFRAYDDWRAGVPAVAPAPVLPRTTVAMATITTTPPLPVAMRTRAATSPRLQLDPSVFRE